jgi:PAS domain S-box-containing protein
VLLASWRAAAQWASWTRRQSRNLLTSITESMDGGLLAVDAGGRILYQNAAFSELWEIPAGFMQEGEARILFGFLRDRLDEPEAFAAMIERALQVPERVDENLRLKDGRVFRCRTNPLPGEPAVPGRVFSFFEITEHTRIEAERQVRESRRERQNEALTTLAQRLAQSAPGGRALALREICEVTAAALEVGRVSLWTCEGEDEAPHCAEFSDRLPESDPATTAQRVAAYADLYRCLPPERPVVIDDAREDARVREACERQPLLRDITSLVQLPVETDGRIAGVVSLVHVGVPRRWTGDEQRFASAVASLCAAALEQFRRQQAQQELGHALEFQRQMAETACSAIYQLDAEGRIVAVNSALCRLTGHLPEDLIGQPVSILGAGACGAECQMLGDGLHEPLLRHPCWMSDRNGRRLDIVRNASSIVDSEGRHAGTIVSFVDVSEVADARRQAEEALRMSQRAQAKLRTADERVEALEAEMIQLRGGLEGREREQREDRERIQALEKELTQGREEREAAQWSGTTARRDAEEMRAERDGALAASAAARRELEAAHGETESARRETEVARGEQAQARAEVEAVRRDLDESREDASRVRAQVQEAQEDRRMPERELLRAKTELAQVRAELGATREAVESARCQAESAYQELRASRQEGEASRAEAVAFARQVTGLQEQVDRLKTDLEASRASTGAAEAARAAAEQRAAAEKRAAMERRVATPTAAGGKAATLPRSLPTPARAAPVARPAAPSAIDFAALLAAVGGDHDLATRRLHAFQKGAPWMLSRLRQAFVKKNALALVSAAESIRQATADLSAREAVRRAEQLEELARSGDLAKLETALNELEAEVERVRAALSSLPRAA